MDSYYVVFDAGTQSVKVAVYSFAGKCVAAATAKTSLQYPRPGWVEMDIDEYYRSVKNVCVYAVTACVPTACRRRQWRQ
ncbi:FGGY family carbohydrate kinase [Megasphaera lornae]|uniref:FGGY family carbohydrate kinase n=1 Tax=Megasphaera lornae TaxID=1000568 RepID=UPI00031C35CA|nr:FGGY family carbohydrate kinase [Megasphaera lornae]